MKKKDEIQNRFESNDEQNELNLKELMNVEGGEDSEPDKNCGLGCFIGGMTDKQDQNDVSDEQQD